MLFYLSFKVYIAGGSEGGGVIGVVGPSGFLGKVSPFFFFDIKIQRIPITMTATITQNNVMII